jgi:CheY-like chemotaxis protein
MVHAGWLTSHGILHSNLKGRRPGVKTCDRHSRQSAISLGDSEDDWRDRDLKSSRPSGTKFTERLLPAGGGKTYFSYTHPEGTCMVLSVDDDPVNHMVLEGFLKPQGYLMESKLNGQEALSYLADCNVLPDIILLDWMMPGMSGLEVAKKVCEDTPFPSSPCHVALDASGNTLPRWSENPLSVSQACCPCHRAGGQCTVAFPLRSHQMERVR